MVTDYSFYCKMASLWLLFSMKSVKIPKGQSETVNQRRSGNGQTKKDEHWSTKHHTET